MEKLIKLYVLTQAKLKDEKGATMVEYGLMLALIAAVCLGAVGLIGTSADTLFDGIAAKLALPAG